MCIRDRIIAVEKRYTRIITESRSYDIIIAFAIGTETRVTVTAGQDGVISLVYLFQRVMLIAVSYTHLDVYKRQVYYCYSGNRYARTYARCFSLSPGIGLHWRSLSSWA